MKINNHQSEQVVVQLNFSLGSSEAQVQSITDIIMY